MDDKMVQQTEDNAGDKQAKSVSLTTEQTSKVVTGGSSRSVQKNDEETRNSTMCTRTADDSFEESPNDKDYSPSELDPPPSYLEKLRDKWLQFLGGTIHFWIGVSVMILIIADGAFFFFLLIGAQRMCRPRTDCEPRNFWYNWSIQFLNVLFTYLATISLPWRISNASHLFGSARQSTSGLDLYGQPTEEIWYHIRQRRRRWIVVFLIANSLTQYANQATRIVYYNYELQDTHPGNIWTNVFFVASMLFAAIGGFCQLYEETKLRKEYPERFPPGLVDVAMRYLRVVICRKKLNNEGSVVADVEDQRPLPEREESERKRCFHGLRKWIKSDKTSLDMWGL